MDVSVIVPFFEERESLPRLLDALDAAQARLAALGKRSEVIIIDDGSRDGSWELLRAAARGAGATGGQGAGSG
jgi:glycosyltransferase involved in cell wall biosynthesis